MSYAERRRRKDMRAKPGRLDRTSSWSVHAFGACEDDCIWCATKRAVQSGNVRTLTVRR